jgi:hypothetical protein
MHDKSDRQLKSAVESKDISEYCGQAGKAIKANVALARQKGRASVRHIASWLEQD